jgi:hypothetical protein
MRLWEIGLEMPAHEIPEEVAVPMMRLQKGRVGWRAEIHAVVGAKVVVAEGRSTDRVTQKSFRMKG